MALLGFAALAQSPIYLDPTHTPTERAVDLVNRMTLQEKVSQMQNTAPGIERLGVPPYDWWSEALHGPIGSPVTVFPQAIGLSSTFDLPLMHQVGTTISDEGRARYYNAIDHGRHGMHEGLTFWAPNVNIFRDPRWGRGQETYGEDPFLTSQMALQFVGSMQDEHDGHLKAVSTPKHYAVHSGPDPERHGFNAVVDPRDMWNTYLPAFRTAVTQAGAYSVMSAYSAVNGTPDSANSLLLQTILRDKWGFRGYVVSDCDAIADMWSGHHAFAGPAEAAAAGVKAGCDLDCGGTYGALVESVQKGLIDEATISKSVVRLFEARIRLGMFDPASSDPYRHLTMADVDSSAHRALAKKAAEESVVMLKNDGILPLKQPGVVAVIGPNADDRQVPLGNYNGSPSHLATVLDGIRDNAPSGTRVVYAHGSSRLDDGGAEVVPSNRLSGVHAEYFANETLSGSPVYTSDTPTLDFQWDNNSPNTAVPVYHFSARFTTSLTVTKTGDYQIGTNSDDGSRLWVDGQQLVDDWTVHAPRRNMAKIHLEAGHTYAVKMEFFQAEGGAVAQLVWATPQGEDFSEAVNLAKSSDVVVMVLGISGELENEELDRKNIDLPTIQQHLLNAVLATGKPVVLVLESGSCLATDDKRIKAQLQAWYPGEEGGNAVGEVLFGAVSPSGRLPVTFYRSLDQVPAFRDYKMDRRTYRYLHPDQKPLYPFGYGLSYSRFSYSKPTVATFEAGSAPLYAEVNVKNSGSVEADEVVEVYSARDGAVWPEPLRRLVGFGRVHLKPGETRRVRVSIPKGAMAQADENGDLHVIPGQYTLSIGGGQPGAEPATSGRDAVLKLNL